MSDSRSSSGYESLSTPLVADACVRLDVPVVAAPQGIRPIAPDQRIWGPALPVRHHGSVDVFLEAFENCRPDDVLVIDNGGRRDEGCIGDLTVLEAQSAGIAGLVVWGCHRDTTELLRLETPVFSYGAYSFGPLDVRTPEDPEEPTRLGTGVISRNDYVFGDSDGVLVVPADRLDEITRVARGIGATERRQAARMHRGETLRQQLQFGEYLKQRAKNPELTFRDYLRVRGGAIEE